MNSLSGILAVLSPDVLAALGRVILTLSKLGELDKETVLTTITDALDPTNAAETAAKALGAEIDALQVRADILAIQGAIAAQEAQRVGDGIGTL